MRTFSVAFQVMVPGAYEKCNAWLLDLVTAAS